MKHISIRKLYLLLFVVQFIPATVPAKMPLVWMNRPDKPGFVATSDEGSVWMLDLVDLARKLDIEFETDSRGERIRFDLPAARIIFTSGTPFVLVDGSLRQIPASLGTATDGIFAPVLEFVEFIAPYYPGEIIFDPAEPSLYVSPPHHDLLGVRVQVSDALVRAVITSRRPLACEVEPDGARGVELFFPDGTVDSLKFGGRYPLLSRVSAHAGGNGVYVEIQPDSGVVFERLQVVDDPPLYIAEFKSGVSGGLDQGVVRRLDEERDMWEMDVVVIDPGHGGRDPGAVGPSGLYEKTVVLDVGLRLRDALEERGIHTIMTREDDTFIPLRDRTKIANRSGGKLFVSLHANALGDRRAHGMETYFLAPTKTDRAMEVAMRENAVIRYEESKNEYQDLTEENFILLSMAQAGFMQESQSLAETLQNTVSTGVGLRNRGVDQAGFYVLIGASMPSVLFEIAYISNRKEEQKLKNANFRQKVAEYICTAVVEFLGRS